MEQRLVDTGVGYGLESMGFSSQFTVSGEMPAYYSMTSSSSSPRIQSDQGRKLTTHLCLLLILKTSGAVLLLLLYIFMLCQANFTIYLHNNGRDGLVTLNIS
jgi:hypothetical protein